MLLQIEHVNQPDHFFQRPQMIGNARSHRRSGPQRLMDADKIVVHEVYREGVFAVLAILGKGGRRKWVSYSPSGRQSLLILRSIKAVR